ncbi:MAG: FIST C-terminal domain-containing protein [Flavobacteriales bacterium]|nr:FIST C-terminal domain-containing protein [Flavobacteriales bacterium]
MSKFGVGFSELTDSRKAGAEAALEALDHCSGVHIHLCFLFCTSRHLAEEFFEGVKSILGSVPYIGGFANGVITNNHFGYDGYQCAVGVLEADDMTIHMYLQEGIAANEYETGKNLFHQVARSDLNEAAFILLFDAVNREKGYFQMNFGTPLFEGARSEIEKWPNIVGARMMGDMKFKPTSQWFGDRMTHNAAMAVAFTGNVEMDTIVLQGCYPASSYHTVTKANGAAILEIDGKPALDFAIDFLGPAVQEDLQKIKFFVTLGKNLGDKWVLDNTQYVNRMCVGIDPKQKGLIMAESDMTEGTEFQLMRRGFDLDKIEKEIRTLVRKVEDQGRRPLFSLYFNCAGRATAYSQQNEEDALYVQRAINDRFPVLGFYEAGELAKVAGDLQVLDWSGVFSLFSVKD